MSIHDWQLITTTKKVALGKHTVADPKICHGKLTVRGSRVFVAQVLEKVADNIRFKRISEAWPGCVSEEAVVEALLLAREALLEHWPGLEIKDAKPDVRTRRKHGGGLKGTAGQLANTDTPNRGGGGAQRDAG